MKFSPPAPFNSIVGLVWLALLVFALIYVSNNVAFIAKHTAKKAGA